GRLDVPVPPPLTEELVRVARSLSVPLKSVLLAAHVKVMGLLSGRHDVMTGLLENGRPEIADGERILGLFLNAVCFRLELTGGTWEDLVLSTFAAEREQAPHRRYPLSELQRARGGQPLFDTVFNFTHFHVYRELRRLPGIEVLGADASEQTYYDLTVQANLDHDTSRLRLELDYRRSAFGPGQIEAVAAAWQRVLAAIVAAPGEREDASPLLSAAERHTLLSEWNDSAGAPVPALGLHQLFESQAARTPDAPAAFADGETLTYRDLSARANRLARHLRRLGIGPESLCGVALERSPDLLVAILAVLKAGGAFVPLDPRAPAERLAFMLADSGVQVLLTVESFAAGLPPHGARTVLLDRDHGAWAAQAEHDPGLPAAPGQLAYVIYTSGSTGTPKGVLGHHGGTLNRLLWMWETFPYEPGEVCCQKTFLSFVDSIAEIFGPLLRGVPSVLVPDDVARDPERLLAVLASRGVTRLVLVPSLLRVLLDAPGDLAGRVPRLSHWVASGESLPAELAERFAERMPGRVLLNIYGSSEVAADVTWAPASAAAGFSGVPVGRPIANCRVYVLDARLQPVPPGATGQVAVGGAHVARGYLHHPALTAERFVPDPFGEEPGGRLYLMGDLGRYRVDGHLELLGRIDRQVKVRGVRVEIGEVEAALLRHPGVRQAVVHAWDGAGEPRLTSYVVGEGEPAPGPAELREFLRGRLPEPMTPTAWVTLAALPLTPSGKIDRRALPPPSAPGEEAERSFVAPRTPAEELLAGIWADVLDLPRVGIEDDFASLGGHSLLATQVVSRIRETLKVELPLRRLLESPTVAELASELAAGNREELPPPVAPVPRGGDLPLSFAQQRLCFLDGLTPGNPVYNLPGAVRLSGALDVAALAGSVAEVVRRHEALRTTFDTAAGRSRQVIAPAGPVPLPVLDLSGLPSAAREREAWSLVSEEARRPFDLVRGPLLRALLLRKDGGEHWFLLTLHHVVSDGWSQGIFIEELAGLYAANAAGYPAALPPLPVQYADFAAWQRAWLDGPVLARQVGYWKRQLEGLPVLALPADRPRPEASSHRGAVERLRLGKDLVDGARALARREGSSLFMTLLSAFAILLSYRSGQEDLAIGTDVANRNVRETERMIGFFVNQLVLRVGLAGDPTGREVIARVRQVALGAYAHQDLPFEKLVETLAPARELNRTPLFQVKFVLQNAPRPPLAAAGLTLAPLEIDTGTAKFDLLWNLWESEEGGISGALEYSVDLYERATAKRLFALYERVLADLVARPEAPQSAYREALAAWEREQREAEEEAWVQSSLNRFKSIKPKKIRIDSKERSS
ncbi:MAG TPA: amino acid adenylation domain-containing protein, partial [Thermoanaerobaculia bacterium]|nr:amino acid adenylation domain-containing protein [Thermoanaerobaculia bacterium]